MEGDSSTPIVIKIVGLLLIFIGVVGAVSGLYALTLVNDYSSSALSTREASTALVEASLHITKDKNNIKDSLENTRGDVSEASKGVGDASIDIQDASASVEKTSKNIDEVASSLLASAQADREAAVDMKASADAMDLLWGPTNVAKNLRAAAEKIEKSASNMSTASAKLKDASSNTKDTSTKLKDSSKDLGNVSSNLKSSGDRIASTASSVDSLASGVITNLNELVEGLQWLDTVDKQTLLYEIVIYFIVVHLLFAGIGIALFVIAANVYGW